MRPSISIRIKHERNYDIVASKFLCWYLLLDSLNLVLQDVFRLTGSILTFIKLLMGVVTFIFLIKTVLRMNNSQRRSLIYAELIAAVVILWTIVVSGLSSSLSSKLLTIIGVCIPLGVCIAFIHDMSVLYKILCKFTWPILVLMVVDLTRQFGSNYDMHFTYMLLLVMLIHINEAIKNKKKTYYFLAFAELIMLLAYGSRGGIICLAMFIVLNIIEGMAHVSIKTIVYIAAVAFAALIIYMNYNNIIQSLYQLLIARGFNGRTLRLMLSGTVVSHDSGRNELWQNTIQLIREKPFIGWGLFGAVQQMNHPYPHNMFLDLLLTFGVPIGTLLAGVIIYICRDVFIIKDSVARSLIQIFFSCGIIPLMFSSTLFTNVYFYIFIGLAIDASSIQKKTVNSQSKSHSGKGNGS